VFDKLKSGELEDVIRKNASVHHPTKEERA
jgi:hypothetical protein